MLVENVIGRLKHLFAALQFWTMPVKLLPSAIPLCVKLLAYEIDAFPMRKEEIPSAFSSLENDNYFAEAEVTLGILTGDDEEPLLL